MVGRCISVEDVLKRVRRRHGQRVNNVRRCKILRHQLRIETGSEIRSGGSVLNLRFVIVGQVRVEQEICLFAHILALRDDYPMAFQVCRTHPLI
jgi:hypothetical protein